MKHIKKFNESEVNEITPLERAEDADLITLPENIEGTNCGNCQFMDLENGYCKHPEIEQSVTARMCCVYWDAPGVKREWRKNNN